jgi:hypothetical protein
VTRVFSVDRDLYVYLQAYTKGAAAPTPASTSTATPATPTAPDTPVLAFVTFYQDRKKVFETAPTAVLPKPGTRLGVVPLSFKVGLGSLAPGRYDCQVSVIDPVKGKVTFRRYPIQLVR